MKHYRIKISKKFDKPKNKLSTENYKNSGRIIGVDFESDNVIYFVESDGYLAESDGYTSEEKENKIILHGKDNKGEDAKSEVKINKNGEYLFKDVLFTKIEKIEGYLNIKDIYEEPCTLMIYEQSPIDKRDSSEGKIANIYGESNGSFIISSGE